MAEALHREVEELKGMLDAGFAFMEGTKVYMCMCCQPEVFGCRHLVESTISGHVSGVSL